MRTLLVPVVLVALLGSGCAERTEERVAPNNIQAAHGPMGDAALSLEPLGCVIRSAPTCNQGKAPKVTVALTNQTKTDIYLVGSLDASDCQWRYPHCYFEVIGPDGRSAVQAISRCGNMNTLRIKDFVKVPPGKTFDPYQHTDDYGFFPATQLRPDNFRMAGEYRIRFVYSTRSDTIADWGGDGRNSVAANKQLVALFAQMPKVLVRSNEIKVTVVAPGK